MIGDRSTTFDNISAEDPITISQRDLVLLTVSTTAACSSRSETSRPPRPRQSTTPNWRTTPQQRKTQATCLRETRRGSSLWQSALRGREISVRRAAVAGSKDRRVGKIGWDPRLRGGLVHSRGTLCEGGAGAHQLCLDQFGYARGAGRRSYGPSCSANAALRSLSRTGHLHGVPMRAARHTCLVIVGLVGAAQISKERRLFSYKDLRGDPVESRHAVLSPYLFDATNLADAFILWCAKQAALSIAFRVWSLDQSQSTAGTSFSTVRNGMSCWRKNPPLSHLSDHSSGHASSYMAWSASFYTLPTRAPKS